MYSSLSGPGVSNVWSLIHKAFIRSIQEDKFSFTVESLPHRTFLFDQFDGWQGTFRSIGELPRSNVRSLLRSFIFFESEGRMHGILVTLFISQSSFLR